MALFLFILLLIPVLIIYLGVSMSAPKYRGPQSDHFNGKTFINPGGIKSKGFADVLKWISSRQRGAWTEDMSPKLGKRPLDYFNDGVRITFINHSTFLIQVDGLNILTDPIWSKRTSPFTWAGPKRMRVPGIKFKDLPRIHLVLLSHNHYDHLDIQTMRMVFGAHHPMIITPLGVKSYLDAEGITGATDMDWWDETIVNESIKVQAVPAQHFSGRGMFDRDATLWCGYVIKAQSGHIYFAGDTGYNDQTFKEIGARVQNIKVSLIPIGAYKPRWFMSPIHTSPEEAVQIHFDVKSQVSIATHFGTFPLADDGFEDPVRDLQTALSQNNLSSDKFIVMKEGEAQVFE